LCSAWRAWSRRVTPPVPSDVRRARDQPDEVRAARAELRDVGPRTHPALAAIHRDVDNVGTKLLIGDPHQLAAIGAGGGMGLLWSPLRRTAAGRPPG
jgi:hypothetical protein